MLFCSCNFFWIWCFVQRRKHKREWNTYKKLVFHKCADKNPKQCKCDCPFLFFRGKRNIIVRASIPLLVLAFDCKDWLCIALLANTLHCLLTHCIHRQVAQRRNNGSPIHSICAAFQVGLSQTFSHSQKGSEEDATIGVQDVWRQLLCLFVQISHNYHGYERFLDLFIERCLAKILGDLSTFLANGMYWRAAAFNLVLHLGRTKLLDTLDRWNAGLSWTWSLALWSLTDRLYGRSPVDPQLRFLEHHRRWFRRVGGESVADWHQKFP